MPQPAEGVTVDDDEDHAEFALMRLALVKGELAGIDKLYAAVLAISVRHATRALVDQVAADRGLPAEIERLASAIRDRAEKLRAERTKLTLVRELEMVPPASTAIAEQSEPPQS
jgi:hypothetical protein